MAMKFWFGKKGLDATSFNAAGQSAIDEAAEMAVADVAVADDRSEDDAVGVTRLSKSTDGIACGPTD